MLGLVEGGEVDGEGLDLRGAEVGVDSGGGGGRNLSIRCERPKSVQKNARVEEKERDRETGKLTRRSSLCQNN